jgi:N-acetyl sugar amidotransferase
MNATYQICKRCVLDTTARNISFDENGNCNFCKDFIKRSYKILNESSEEKELKLKAFVEKVKTAGKGKRYNCIVGVSGGADSSWTLVKAVELGLKPLAVHMDNGWNSELAQNNISNLVNKLGVDLYTHVIDWAEYKQLMQAFFDADVIDVELLYDNAMLAVNYRLASKFGIKYILSGSNQATEGIFTPEGWNWYKFDKRNIKAIGKRFAGIKPNTFPFFSTTDFIWHEFIRKTKWAAPLDLMEYNKSNAMNFMKEHYDYKLYPYKHYESVFTRFYQGYILPEKFNVDKRKLHYSALIMSGQLERADALEKCKGFAYPSTEALQEDLQYFLKKMSWSPEDLKTYIARPEIPHSFYLTEEPIWHSFIKLGKVVKKYIKLGVLWVE